MKIALITANIGSFDSFKNPVEQLGSDISIHVYTEKNLPVPLPHLNNRLKGKYIKIMTHRFLPDYDYYVWIDGNVHVHSDFFVLDMLDEGNDISICKHHERNDVYEEIDYIIENMNSGAEYLLKRYATDPWYEEYEFYENSGMPDVPLYACKFFCRKNSPKVNEAFEEWWLKCVEYTNFDQTMFSYISWKFGLTINEMDYLKTVDKHLKITKH